MIIAAKSKCIKGNLSDFMKLFLKFAFDEDSESDDQLDCVRYNLQKIDQSSKYAAKLNASDTINDENCRYYDESIEPFRSIHSSYVKAVGPLNETTCGVISQHDSKILSFLTILVSTEKNNEIKTLEALEIFKFATEKLQKWADCILENI